MIHKKLCFNVNIGFNCIEDNKALLETHDTHQSWPPVAHIAGHPDCQTDYDSRPETKIVIITSVLIHFWPLSQCKNGSTNNSFLPISGQCISSVLNFWYPLFPNAEGKKFCPIFTAIIN